MPKNRSKRDQETNAKAQLDKAAYVTAAVDVLRATCGNDYEKVAKMLQLEVTKTGDKKGFTTKSSGGGGGGFSK